jgi:BirA family biotin operon repressor/biotin-[acetyl-CoA-carboxylase] ligase
MILIKLDAIDSTNEFLKAMSGRQSVENFTVVSAENQTNGKGQMGAKWLSEIGKNLIMSILVKDTLKDNTEIFTLNSAIALAVITALKKYSIPKLSIKWPNDIMSDTKKIGGILIENTIKNNGEIVSIVGIGLNVNQTDFDALPKASSLAVIMKTTFDKETLLFDCVEAIKTNVSILKNDLPTNLWSDYNQQLFKKGIPMPFSNASDQKFMGIIQDVNASGQLNVLLENDTIATFGIKEIQMLY